MKKMFRTGLLLFAVLAMVFALAGCGGGGEKAEQTAGEGEKQAAESQKLIFGSDTSYPPFESFDANGELVGFDVDLIAAINEVAGLDIEIQTYDFKGLIPALESASIDGSISAMTIKPERAEVVDFSLPYYKSGLSVAVRADNDTIKSFDDLDGKKIGVQTGTTGELEAKNVPNSQIVSFDTIVEAFMDLNNGAVDAVVNDYPVTAYYITTEGEGKAKIVGDMRTSEFYGIAIPKQKPEVLEQVNEALLALKENGKFDEIYKKWFGEAPPEYLPGDPPQS
ncbi:MAG TPA: basic amino acid ABC transporter substrate-binding protein [Desulfotomaculum sp.]|nr:MAG: glutamine ABC transporter substrate-binding protein [Peptococcaceae bacterium BRH_c8a]KJS72699.1 MAG: glutamine ABC transporter substrate-binding protein [Desulfotomaculum sp. BICA1-6]HBX23221.1 basic amino acid ABC transporter substrate-binding protein [Desulfotomaculum sp.]